MRALCCCMYAYVLCLSVESSSGQYFERDISGVFMFPSSVLQCIGMYIAMCVVWRVMRWKVVYKKELLLSCLTFVVYSKMN